MKENKKYVLANSFVFVSGCFCFLITKPYLIANCFLLGALLLATAFNVFFRSKRKFGKQTKKNNGVLLWCLIVFVFLMREVEEPVLLFVGMSFIFILYFNFYYFFSKNARLKFGVEKITTAFFSLLLSFVCFWREFAHVSESRDFLVHFEHVEFYVGIIFFVVSFFGKELIILLHKNEVGNGFFDVWDTPVR